MDLCKYRTVKSLTGKRVGVVCGKSQVQVLAMASLKKGKKKKRTIN